MLCTSTPESADDAAPFLRLPSRERDRERDRERERAVPLEPRGAVPEAVVVPIVKENTAVCACVGNRREREKQDRLDPFSTGVPNFRPGRGWLLCGREYRGPRLVIMSPQPDR